MPHLHDLTIKKFHEGLLNKEFTAAEIVKAYFDFLKKKDAEIGAYLSLCEEDAFLQAEKADLKIAKNETLNMLGGVPLAIKDNILIDGHPATAGSKMLENYKAVYDATVIKKLKSADAVFLGKTNLDEFAMGSSTENSGFKITKNPRDT
ncbi:MAG: amidase, partial [Patescibacteria group bacterium]